MKKLLIILCLSLVCLCCAFGFMACDYSGKNDYSYSPTNNTNKKDIFEVYEGAITAVTEYGATLKEISVPEKINGEQITAIETNAFANCNNTKKIFIPNSVTSIGQGALFNCGQLTELTIPFVGSNPNNKSASAQSCFGFIFGRNDFSGATKTGQTYADPTPNEYNGRYYYIPSSLKIVNITGGRILRGAFYDCELITNITIGEKVTEIGKEAFYNCKALKDIYIPNANIGERAFVNTSLQSVTIGDGVTEIGKEAFYNCKALKDIYIPNANIGELAFYNCSLTSITIGEGVTSIGTRAFYGSYNSLKSVIFKQTQGWTIRGTKCVNGANTYSSTSVSLQSSYIEDSTMLRNLLTLSDYNIDNNVSISGIEWQRH